ncbi:Tetratricopeptide repeat protein 1 [Quillaja saponaria]|uniref:Tetratricopeptide repeat protein 1 n=1 Tax=Quillaja saponaria TaxID=32244 RepID=A0AAD7LCQ1_QUISA|nr:Tetratricopeptide repeat protein 1 [Quillaja saponaria]
MVVIQLEETEQNNVNHSKPATETSTAAVNADGNREVSDGFETASDGELGSDDDKENGASTLGKEHEEQKQGQEQQKEQHQKQQEVEQGQEQQEEHHQKQQELEQEQGIPPKSDSSEDVVKDEESKQKALEQANDAKLEGNKLFGDGNYEEALFKYELALQVAPEMPSSAELRSICHSNRGVCFLKLGKYDDTVKECTKALELNPIYIKALVRKGEAHEKLEHFEEAIADMKKILEVDPSNDQARKSIRRLEPLAEQKREKMKEEMIGKLKEMGNSLLGRFGMSTDNFKAVKDPNTGSYSVSFQR